MFQLTTDGEMTFANETSCDDWLHMARPCYVAHLRATKNSQFFPFGIGIQAGAKVLENCSLPSGSMAVQSQQLKPKQVPFTTTLCP